MMNILLTDLRKNMGTNAMFYSSFNPNGRYTLDLSNSVQRGVAKNLVAINKRVYAKIMAKEMVDRSQMGNASCFRNEKVGGKKFEMHPLCWRLPTQGVFEFDFQCFDMQPDPAQLSGKEDIMLLLEWFETTFEMLSTAAKQCGKQ